MGEFEFKLSSVDSRIEHILMETPFAASHLAMQNISASQVYIRWLPEYYRTLSETAKGSMPQCEGVEGTKRLMRSGEKLLFELLHYDTSVLAQLAYVSCCDVPPIFLNPSQPDLQAYTSREEFFSRQKERAAIVYTAIAAEVKKGMHHCVNYLDMQRRHFDVLILGLQSAVHKGRVLRDLMIGKAKKVCGRHVEALEKVMEKLVENKIDRYY